jgi:hypothetical protein
MNYLKILSFLRFASNNLRAERQFKLLVFQHLQILIYIAGHVEIGFVNEMEILIIIAQDNFSEMYKDKICNQS